MEVKNKIIENKTFRFIDFGSETHGRTSFRLWISRNYPAINELNFPVSGDINITEKGTIVLIQSEEKTIYDVFIRCGYRGSSNFEVISPADFKMLTYRKYESPQGNCGISKGALIVLKKDIPLKLKWTRSGRLYGSPGEGFSIYYSNGKIEEIEEIEEIEDLKEL